MFEFVWHKILSIFPCVSVPLIFMSHVSLLIKIVEQQVSTRSFLIDAHIPRGVAPLQIYNVSTEDPRRSAEAAAADKANLCQRILEKGSDYPAPTGRHPPLSCR